MLKHTLVLTGTSLLSLVAVVGLMWFMSSSPPVAYADLDCVGIISDITANDTWTRTCYRVMTNTVTIHPNVILTISPPVTGTRVEFQDGAQLQVLGNLQARGTASRLITFTSINAGKPGRCNWLGIILADDGGGDLIQHAVIEYACTGVKIDDENNVDILSSTLRYNGGNGNTDGAIGGDTDYSRIRNNHIHSCANGIALGEAFSNDIVSNTIHNIDKYGLVLIKEGASPGGSLNTIKDNEIYACGRDGLRLEDGYFNRVLSNTIYSVFTSAIPGGAICLSGQRWVSIQSNHVYSNGAKIGYQAAIYVTGTCGPLDISSNVIYDKQDDAIEYAASSSSCSPTMTFNALCSMPITSYELRNDDIINNNAPYNWWGTNTPTAGVNYAGPVDLNTFWITLSLAGSANGIVTVTLRDQVGHTVPPPPDRQTNPPAPNARRIELSTNWGTLSPTVVVNGQGIATATLAPGEKLEHGAVVLTATDFCGYTVTATLNLPNLVITKTAAVSQVVAGEMLTYRISYANAGTAAANDVRITDALPNGMIWISDTAVANGWTRLATASRLIWTTPTLSPGAHGSFVLSVTAVPTACGLKLTNTVTITTPTIETGLSDNSDSAPIQVICADLEIAKTTDINQVVLGGLVTYTITYQNDADADAQNVILTDTWSLPGTRWYSDTAEAVGWTRTQTLPAVVWITPALTAGISGSFQLVLQVPDDAACGDPLTNTVFITTTTSESDTLNNRAAATCYVFCPVDFTVIKDDDVGPFSTLNAPLVTDKRAAVDRLLRAAQGQTPLAAEAATQHREFVYEGDLITYTIAVVNTSSYLATDVVLTETLPEYASYVGGGWAHVSGRTYTKTVGTLLPDDGRIYYFVVRVDDRLPAGVDTLVNLVCGGSDEFDIHPDDNCNYEDTPVYRSGGQNLYVANLESDTVDVFEIITVNDTISFTAIISIPVGSDPFGMVITNSRLFVANFESQSGPSILTIIENDLNNLAVVTATTVGRHPIHVAAYGDYVYVANHSGGEGITVVDCGGQVVARVSPGRPRMYDFGFFGVTADEKRGLIYATKRDFGGQGIWTLTPGTWDLNQVVDTGNDKPSSIVYHPDTDEVYVTLGLIDELRVYDPDSWELLEQIRTGHQHPEDPGYGGHGLAALGQCVFVSNYLDQSVTAVTNGSCVDSQASGPIVPPAGPYKVYLPLVVKNLGIVRTIRLSGRPKGMTAAGNLLFVTLPSEDRVVVIDARTLTVIAEIAVPGSHPHTVILAESNAIDLAP